MNEQATPQTPPQEQAPPPRRASFWRIFLFSLLLLFAALVSGLAWLSASEAGFAWALRAAGQLSGGHFSVAKAEGTLWRGFALRDVRVRSAYDDIDIESLRLDWQPERLWRGWLDVDRLALGHVRVASRPQPQEKTAPPQAPRTLSLPFKIHVGELSLASLTLQPGQLSLYRLSASYRYDGANHSLQLKRLDTPWGGLRAGVNLAAASPFALSGQLAAQGELEHVAVKAELKVSGSLLQPAFAGELDGKGVSVDVSGALKPFEANAFNRLTRLDARVGNINPQAILPSWPKGRVSFAVFAEPDAGQRVKGGLTLINAESGALSAQHLPLSLLAGEFRADAQALELYNSYAELAGGRVDVAGELKSDRIKLALDLKQLALRKIHEAAPDDAISGRVTLEGAPSAPNIAAQLKGKLLQAEALTEFSSGKQPALLLRKLELSAGGGHFSAAGKLGLAGKQLFELNGQLSRADPSRLLPSLPKGDLNASLKLGGQLAEPMEVGAKLQFAPSKLSGASLSGSANLLLAQERLKQLLMDVRLADNRLQASGSYGAAGDKLKLAINAPNLSLLGPGFAGTVQGQGELAGVPKAPLLNAKLQAERLRLPGGVSLQSMQFSGNIKADQASPFQLSLDVAALQAGGLRAEQLRARASGTRAKHSLQLDGRFRLNDLAYGLQFAAAGGLGANHDWQGGVQRLELSGSPAISLLSPVALTIGGDGQVKLGATRLSALGGNLSLSDFTRQANGALSGHGSARGLRLAELGSLLKLPIEHNLQFDADWGLSPAGVGQVSVWRSGGDIQLPLDKKRKAPLGLKTARADLTLDGRMLNFNVNLDSRFAQAQGQGSLPWNGGQIDGRTPLSGTVRASLPSLAVLAELAGPGLELGGQLSAAMELSGPLSQPQAQGQIRGERLKLADHRTGITLDQGSLLARLDGRQLQLQQLRFVSGKGEVNASGSLDFSHEQPDARVKVTLQRFSVFDKPNRRLVVSGQSELAFIGGKLSLNGRIRSDYGRVGLPKLGAPDLGGDVVVVGRAAPEPSAFASMPLTVALDLDLGDRFRFSGQGLDVELSGQVRVTANPGEAPAAKGQVKVDKGRYKAYGQDLDITFGAITFNGPLDNPLLNVQATRRLSPVGAGVEVSGSVSAPKVRLITDEPMADKDKLAWLVLGRAASGDRDNNDLAASAGMMLAGSINDHVGLFDDLGVSSRKERTLANGTVSPAEQVVTVGRQLTRELYLGYEYGISSADQAVKLAYQLSKSWSVILKAGTAMSAESRYTVRFD
ncbi:translocation/assembly module TamB domain-containing protein [Chromobacterium sp. IIBBL 290-4]|uniref:translocation/assembly module TamB domain-containing protein n=1 Tax=Chromobacterium sp. IIBBL 290-4 TaxID=2953890 RepID=UPI0020B64433|nr:translocation/assembly module TamB domain-containing protein [Chromobacterium sp. IIBBL 290-4]UTH76227.1 translocation/assembly module TamB domain-containing protein [Chromobacterium sp. IIBBL 290-4]